MRYNASGFKFYDNCKSRTWLCNRGCNISSSEQESSGGQGVQWFSTGCDCEIPSYEEILSYLQRGSSAPSPSPLSPPPPSSPLPPSTPPPPFWFRAFKNEFENESQDGWSSTPLNIKAWSEDCDGSAIQYYYKATIEKTFDFTQGRPYAYEWPFPIRIEFEFTTHTYNNSLELKLFVNDLLLWTDDEPTRNCEEVMIEYRSNSNQVTVRIESEPAHLTNHWALSKFYVSLPYDFGCSNDVDAMLGLNCSTCPFAFFSETGECRQCYPNLTLIDPINNAATCYYS